MFAAWLRNIYVKYSGKTNVFRHAFTTRDRIAVANSANALGGSRRGFGAADQAIEVFENLAVDAVRAVCEEVCEQWRSLKETK